MNWHGDSAQHITLCTSKQLFNQEQSVAMLKLIDQIELISMFEWCFT